MDGTETLETGHKPITAGAEATRPEKLLIGLIQTKMLYGEDEELFNRFILQVVAKTHPESILEEILVSDYIDYSWEVLRLRRFRDTLLRVRAPDGFLTILR